MLPGGVNTACSKTVTANTIKQILLYTGKANLNFDVLQ